MISLSDVKSFLSIPEEDTSNDSKLTSILAITLSAVDLYCQRKLSNQEHTEKVRLTSLSSSFFVDQYPLTSVTSVLLDGEEVDFQFNSENGKIYGVDGESFFPGEYTVNYFAGYTEVTIDPLLKNVILMIVGSKYSKSNTASYSGDDDIKRVSLTGLMTVEYRNNDSSQFNDYLEGYQDALDSFRSERVYFSA